MPPPDGRRGWRIQQVRADCRRTGSTSRQRRGNPTRRIHMYAADETSQPTPAGCALPRCRRRGPQLRPGMLRRPCCWRARHVGCCVCVPTQRPESRYVPKLGTCKCAPHGTLREFYLHLRLLCSLNLSRVLTAFLTTFVLIMSWVAADGVDPPSERC